MAAVETGDTEDGEGTLTDLLDHGAAMAADTEAAAKCPEVPEVSGAVGVEPAGAVVLLIKSFFPQNEKKSCLLSDKLPKNKPCPPVLYFIMMVLLLLYTLKH